MIITYLHHSGFVVECGKQIFIFDPITSIPHKFFEEGKPVILCVSHSHGDHYSKIIWDYAKNNIHYVLSSDIFLFGKKDKTFRIDQGETLNIDGAKITAFGSTDAGVSFLIETETETVFFAGDLNWWAWDPATRPRINPKVEERDYKAVLSQLKKYLDGKQIDCAFIPVDPRLDLPDGSYWAALYFIEEFKPKELVPMHFWGDFDIIHRLIQKLPAGTATKIGVFDHQNQIVQFE